ncbi:MAG TPA: ATP-binding cassette domain-containing protein [Acidimicrobiales bacterium]|nr:ATP-binding cassette domain-containing protein [Acidimicrobiales bacterium]
MAIVDLDLTIRAGEHWVVLGPNGSGKSTLLSVLSMYQHPTRGTATILGRTMGRTDVREHRHRIGLAGSDLEQRFRESLSSLDLVVTALHGALEPWWHEYGEADTERARRCLDRMGVGHLAARGFGTLSSGERKKVQLARTLMTEPELILLDEPGAGLDLAGREGLIADLTGLTSDPDTPPVVLVTHHVEEIPPGFTHGLLLSGGRVVAIGSLTDVLTAPNLSRCFGIDLDVDRHRGRWVARARPRR